MKPSILGWQGKSSRGTLSWDARYRSFVLTGLKSEEGPNGLPILGNVPSGAESSLVSGDGQVVAHRTVQRLNQYQWLKGQERFFYSSSGRLASERRDPMPSEDFTEESLEDHPRGTMHVLPRSLELGDGSAHACARAVLCSAFDHLFRRYCYRTNENGEDMCTLLALTSRV